MNTRWGLLIWFHDKTVACATLRPCFILLFFISNFIFHYAGYSCSRQVYFIYRSTQFLMTGVEWGKQNLVFLVLLLYVVSLLFCNFKTLKLSQFYLTAEYVFFIFSIVWHFLSLLPHLFTCWALLLYFVYRLKTLLIKEETTPIIIRYVDDNLLSIWFVYKDTTTK